MCHAYLRKLQEACNMADKEKTTTDISNTSAHSEKQPGAGTYD